MIYRTAQDEICCETKEDFDEMFRIRDDLKVKAKYDKELFKKLTGDYIYSLPIIKK